jgi:AraC-like DNA-binding protein
MGLVEPNFRTSDAATCQEFLFRVTGTHRLSLPPEAPQAPHFEFSHQHAALGRLCLNQANFSSGFRVRKLTRASYFSFQFILSGNCALEYANNGPLHVGSGDLFVVDPDATTQEYWSDGSSQYIVRIEREEMEAAIRDAFGSSHSNVRFKRVYRDPGIAVWLNQVFRTLNDTHESGGGVLRHQQVSHHLGQTVLMMLLTGLEHSIPGSTSCLEPRWVPYYVRRAEKYFNQNFVDNVTMEDVAAAAGVSTRTLFYGFHRWLGTTPMKYLRDLRLDVARNELSNGRTGSAVVSSAALVAGFTNFGQFSKLYRARFGEKPSTSLMRARLTAS